MSKDGVNMFIIVHSISIESRLVELHLLDEKACLSLVLWPLAQGFHFNPFRRVKKWLSGNLVESQLLYLLLLLVSNFFLFQHSKSAGVSRNYDNTTLVQLLLFVCMFLQQVNGLWSTSELAGHNTFITIITMVLWGTDMSLHMWQFVVCTGPFLCSIVQCMFL